MQALEHVVREDWGRLTALLLARFRRLGLVEDSLADAVEAAATTWPDGGIPGNPSAWILTVARRRILDRLRAEAMHATKMPLLVTDAERRSHGSTVMIDPGGLIEDDLLRLVLMCAHPALGPEAASALTLRLVLGVSTHDIARLFLVPEPTMAARLTRAKRKIVAAAIPFAIPSAADLPERLEVVARTIYLAFTEGYAPGSGPDPLRTALAGEAIRLARVVRGLADSPTLTALLALMLLQHSRRDARVDADGEIILLADQERDRWHHTEIDEAVSLLTSTELTGPLAGLAATYAVQARIALEHALAPIAADTRWDRIVQGYDVLLQIDPSPAAALARAVAVAEAEGPEAGLAALNSVDLPTRHRAHAVRAELLARLGREDEALNAYNLAVSLCHNQAEADHLRRRLQSLEGETR